MTDPPKKKLHNQTYTSDFHPQGRRCSRLDLGFKEWKTGVRHRCRQYYGGLAWPKFLTAPLIFHVLHMFLEKKKNW